jgi:carbamoyl-phosphate synthase large subunit
MIQEYVDDKEGEFTNSVSVALDGDILGCICMKRELVKGSSIRITIDEFPEVKKQMIEIAQKIGSPGPINIQCRLKNGKALVFEINSRFSTTNVVRAACGYNEVEILVDNFLNGKKLFIDKYQKKIAMAYLEYALVEPNQIKHFIDKGTTTVKAEINNWL